MAQFTMKELIVLAYRGIEASEREIAEAKASLNKLYNDLLEEEKKQAEKVKAEEDKQEPDLKEDKKEKSDKQAKKAE